MSPKPLVAGNWKMNGLKASVSELKVLGSALQNGAPAACEVLICPPFTLIQGFVAEARRGITIGAQDCHTNISGAHTGDISPEMLEDVGSGYVIVGHSERRADHGETSDLVCAKAEAVLRTKQAAIICVGETEAERRSGDTLKIVVDDQLAKSVPDSATSDNTVIAYEPVWAIGTGLTPTVDDVAEVHTAIRNALVARFGDAGNLFRILYGGSVKPSNAVELMGAANVDGALVGGASLKAEDFNGIIEAYR
jgi:triosephosphate isomerase